MQDVVVSFRWIVANATEAEARTCVFTGFLVYRAGLQLLFAPAPMRAASLRPADLRLPFALAPLV